MAGPRWRRVLECQRTRPVYASTAMARHLPTLRTLVALTALVGVITVAAYGAAVTSPSLRPPSESRAGEGPATASPNQLSASAPSLFDGGPNVSLNPAPSPSPGPSPTVLPTALPTCPRETERFPAGYAAYHTYAGLCQAIVSAAAAHPDIVRLFSIGRSSQGRTIWAMEISSHLADGTHPPGVLFDGLHHALEHLSLEMNLATMSWLLDGYDGDPTIRRLVQTRAIFIIFDVNPDGAAFDIAGGQFHDWRKNRQPGPGGAIGTDLNRNYADHWGCCGLVSIAPTSPYYRGPAPFSAPETLAVRDFVEGLVFDGRQEIRAAITFHTSGRLVLWPYGYTRAAIPSDMSAEDHAVFVKLGQAMAQLNRYTAEQASALYLDSGTARDWYYGAEHIFSFTFELGTGAHQASDVISTETARNRAAVLYLIDMADCPYRAIGMASTFCG